MKYQVTVTSEIPFEGANTKYRDHEIFKQSFEELDLAALAIFLNRPPIIPMTSRSKASPDKTYDNVFTDTDGTSSEVTVFQE